MTQLMILKMMFLVSPGILDTAAYGAAPPWADGNVLMQGGSASPSALLILAPTRLSQGALRRKNTFFPLRSQAHFGKTKYFFFSACLAVTANSFGHSAKSLMFWRPRRWTPAFSKNVISPGESKRIVRVFGMGLNWRGAMGRRKVR